MVESRGKEFSETELLRRASGISSFVEADPNGVPALVKGVSLTNNAIVHPGRAVPSPNVEAVGNAYFSPELRARYGTYAIETLARNSDAFAEDAKQRPTEIELNLKSLGLSKAGLEAQGLDLGGPGRTFSITDTSNGSRNWISFRHTKDKGDSLNPPSDEPAQTAALPSDQPGQRYVEQALIALRSSPNIPVGMFTKEEEERLAGSLSEAALSATPPLTRIDQVVLGHNRLDTGKPDRIFALQGGLDDPAHNRAQLPLDQALAKPLDQTSERVNELTLAQQREQARIQAEAVEKKELLGPAIRMSGP